MPYIALFGDYIKNTDPGDDDDGYLFGILFGDKKVKRKNQWQFTYMFRRLERDAWPDIFPDSDFYDGETNAKGHEAIFTYGLNKNLSLALDYYNSENIRGTDRDEDVVQVDMNFKF